MNANFEINVGRLVQSAISDILSLLDGEYTINNMIDAIHVVGAIDHAVRNILVDSRFSQLTELEADVVHEIIFDSFALKAA
jgi:hypothetical protein